MSDAVVTEQQNKAPDAAATPANPSKPEPRSAADLSQDPVVMKKVQYFDDLDSRYRSDGQFKKFMDPLLKGDYAKLREMIQADEVAKEVSGKKNIEDEDLDLDERVAKRIAELDKKVDEVRNMQAFKDVTNYKTNVGMQYLKEFDTLADEAGYAADTPAYNMVYQLAEKAGKDYARRIGLVDNSGNPDPQLQFNPQLIKKAFEIAHNQMKQIGYDAVEDKRKKILAEREERAKKQDARLMEIINPKKLKTFQDRTSAMERGFKYLMQSKHGINL